MEFDKISTLLKKSYYLYLKICFMKVFRIILFLFIIIIITSQTYTTSAQNLPESRHSSELTYIYKISDKEAREIFRKSSERINTSWFHTLIDTYPTDSTYKDILPSGHYIRTFAEENKQMCEYTYIPEFDVMILNNNTDLCIQVYDLQGNIIRNAEIKIKSKKLKYDKKLNAIFIKSLIKKDCWRLPTMVIQPTMI